MTLKDRISKTSFNKDYLIVIAMWIVAELLLFSKFGFGFEMEAKKYIREADFILENRYLSQGRYLFYLSTIIIIALSSALKIGLYGAIAFILIINLSSYLLFFKALKKIFNARPPAFIVIFFLLSFWPYQSWSLFLYTECLFYSFVILLFSHLLLFKSINRKFLIRLFILLLLVVISRPLGVLFIFPVLLFLFFHLNRKQRIFLFGSLVAASVLLVWVVQIVFTTTPDWNMKRAFLEDSMICDMPLTANNNNLILSDNSNQLYRLFYYVTHNFSHFSGLAVKRLKYFFLNTRDYYSPMHNLYLLTILAFIYGSIILGFKNIRKVFSTAGISFIFSIIFLFALTVALQCDDYHNRFFLTLMPMLTVAAVAGCRPLVIRLIAFFQNKI
jgi:hypothetical protein